MTSTCLLAAMLLQASGIHAKRLDAGPSVMAGFMTWFGNMRGRG